MTAAVRVTLPIDPSLITPDTAGQFKAAAAGLTTSDLYHVRIASAPEWSGPYDVVEFVDGRGRLARVIAPRSKGPEFLTAHVAKAKAAVGETDDSLLGQPALASRYCGPWQPLEMEMLPEIVSSFSPAGATGRESPQ